MHEELNSSGSMPVPDRAPETVADNPPGADRATSPSPPAEPDFTLVGPAAPADEQADMQTCDEPAPESEHAPMCDWKEALRAEFEHCLAAIDGIGEAPLETDDKVDEPDLYSFFEQLAALTVELRRANRRVAETLSQWGEGLGGFGAGLRAIQEQLGTISASNVRPQESPRDRCLDLIELSDRLARLTQAFASPPKGSWWGGDSRWRRAWETQSQAFTIVLSHLDSMLRKEGISRITVLGQPFDPGVMTAVAAEVDPLRAHNTVIEEVASGYMRRGELLRPAQVRVSLNKT